MISLVGRRPSKPADWDTKALAATNVAATARAGRVKRRKQKMASGQTVPWNEEDFPPIWRDVKRLFAESHFEKCAFCDTAVTAAYPGDVEHYRPKAALEALTRGSRDDTRGSPRRKATILGDGYEWLAYEWSNYLFACNKCNSIWKRNQFPINGTRATSIGLLRAEAPLLLNPFDLDPSNHFAYDDLSGAIIGNTPEGNATIDVCGLDRSTLETQRRIKAEKVRNRLEEYADALVLHNGVAKVNALRALFDECRDVESYAGMARSLLTAATRLTYEELAELQAQGVF